MFLYPSNKVFFQEDRFLADLVRGESQLHEPVQCLMTDIQRLLRLSEVEEYSLDALATLPVWRNERLPEA